MTRTSLTLSIYDSHRSAGLPSIFGDTCLAPLRPAPLAGLIATPDSVESPEWQMQSKQASTCRYQSKLGIESSRQDHDRPGFPDIDSLALCRSSDSQRDAGHM